MAASKKQRLDEILVARGLVESRSKARALILAGEVLVNDVPADKAGMTIAEDATIRLREAPKYVSRGGLKLEKALEHFAIPVTDAVCLDVGASTGGFTDCLLQHGAKRVYAIDVGYGQMHWKLQSDSRVIRFDRENFRNFDATKIPEALDVCVMDVSFISVKLLISKLVQVMTHLPNSKLRHFFLLIKPQFEVGKEHLGKGGIVKDEAQRERVVQEISQTLKQESFTILGVIPSPITGTDGNVEYLLAAVFPQ